jgi:hypothetical protein
LKLKKVAPLWNNPQIPKKHLKKGDTNESKLASRTALHLRGMLGSAVVALNLTLARGMLRPPLNHQYKVPPLKVGAYKFSQTTIQIFNTMRLLDSKTLIRNPKSLDVKYSDTKKRLLQKSWVIVHPHPNPPPSTASLPGHASLSGAGCEAGRARGRELIRFADEYSPPQRRRGIFR